MSKTTNERSSKWCLFIISKMDMIWSSRTTRKFINYQLWTSYKIYLSLKYLFQFFLTTCWLRFFTIVVNSNFVEIYPFKHSSNKFSLLCCRLLDSYFTCSMSDNKTPLISRVLIGPHLIFANWRHQRIVACLENVRQSNIRRGRMLGFQLSHKHPL